MIMKLLLAGAASAVFASPIAAQEPGMSGTAATEPGAELSAPPASTTAPAKARTGAAKDTAANVSDADLAIGASVKDSAGMELGKISKISKSAGQTVVTLSANGQTTQVPASSLMKSGGVLVSSDNKAEVSSPK
jgi:hypothetical protein